MLQHVTSVQKKSPQRLHVLRKLRAFSVDPKLLLRLYRSITEPLIMYSSTCYYPALSVSNRYRTRLLTISHVAPKIIGLPTPIGRVSLARENEAGGSWGQKVHILHVNV